MPQTGIWTAHRLPWEVTVPGESCGSGMSDGTGPGRSCHLSSAVALSGAGCQPVTTLLSDLWAGLRADKRNDGFLLAALSWPAAAAGNIADFPLLLSSARGLPATTLLLCEYDPLRDEGEAFARRLITEGVNVNLHWLDGLIHGAMHMTDITPEAERCYTLSRFI